MKQRLHIRWVLKMLSVCFVVCLLETAIDKHTYVHIHRYITYLYIYVHICICSYMCAYMHMYVYTHLHTHLHKHIQIHTYVNININIYIYVHTYAYKSTYTYAYIFVNSQGEAWPIVLVLYTSHRMCHTGSQGHHRDSLSIFCAFGAFSIFWLYCTIVYHILHYNTPYYIPF